MLYVEYYDLNFKRRFVYLNKPNDYAYHLFYCYYNIYQIIIIYENHQMYSLPIKKEEVESKMIDLFFDESFEPKETFFTPYNTPFD